MDMDFVRLHAGHRARLSPGAVDIIDSAARFEGGPGFSTQELFAAARRHTGRDVAAEGLSLRDQRKAAAEALSDLSAIQVWDLCK